MLFGALTADRPWVLKNELIEGVWVLREDIIYEVYRSILTTAISCMIYLVFTAAPDPPELSGMLDGPSCSFVFTDGALL